jgi:hypothetical protein
MSNESYLEDSWDKLLLISERSFLLTDYLKENSPDAIMRIN